eukprot:TRINITY_DN19887_c0_g1_i1.p1 TRINITY_DN19887_c0_g1~~TRINITY_DN19887_c0_g1_i1.p1  ORF type:complete len:410 (+),score=15.32 TRINITY_DN19887_c0_g1_i1:51-1232(+)
MDCPMLAEYQSGNGRPCGHDNGHASGHGDGHDHGIRHGDGCCGHSLGHGHAHAHGINGAPERNGHARVAGAAACSQRSDGAASGTSRWKNAVRFDDHLIEPLAQSVQWFNTHDPTECDHSCAFPSVCEQARCDHSQLNKTTNALVIVRAKELITMERVNTFLAILSVLYIAVCLVGALHNSYDNECDPAEKGCDRATSPQLFHNLEFGASFVFNIFDIMALSYSPRTLSNQYENPALLKMLVLFNVCISGGSLLLVAINLKKFEVLSHELEYSNELTIAIFDLVILFNLVRGRRHERSAEISETCVSSVIVLLALGVAGIQLGIYNLRGWTADGDSKGEQPAHYLEFAFGCLSAGITFWFTMDNKLSAEKRLRQIMYGDMTQACSSVQLQEEP